MDDLLSSPDPLNEAVPSSAAPYTRRITRSHSRLTSQEGSSPRKQTFHLDVGNETAPQKIRVTVEAEEFNKENNHVSRRLFASPTPKRAMRPRERSTTTTVVPLKGLADEGNGVVDRAATPRRRGRPPKSGTPAASTKKPAGTPLRRSTRKPRKAAAFARGVLGSEASAATDQTTPKTTRRTPAKRKRATESRDDEVLSQGTLPRKRGRKPRQPDVVIYAEGDAGNDASENDITLDSIEVSTADEKESLRSGRNGSATSADEDIWMATLSDAPATVGRRAAGRRNKEADTSAHGEQPAPSAAPLEMGGSAHSEQPEQSAAPSEAPESESDAGGYQDFAGADDNGDLDIMSESSTTGERDQDTVMDGENFTMISMQSVPSFHASHHVATSDLPEIGETTSLIINKTLEALRQSQREEAAEEEEVSPAEDGEKTPTARSPANADAAMLPEQHGTPGHSAGRVSPISLSRSPRRKAQPLGRQLALKALQKGAQPVEIENRGEASLLLPSHEGASIYDDSFSEIPEAVLEAATPRRPTQLPMANVVDEAADEQSQAAGEDASVSRSPSHDGSNQMLTPNDTPSPAVGEQPEQDKLGQEAESAASSEPGSSPPVFFSQQPESRLFLNHSRQSSEGTPVPSHGSPQRPPSAAGGDQDANLSVPSATFRPVLSPIVRVGRTLQTIMSDPPSPPSHGSVLGSPFRSSVRGSSPPAGEDATPVANPVLAPQDPTSVQQTDRSWSKAFAPFSHLKNLVVQSAQVFSPRANAQKSTEASPSLKNNVQPAPADSLSPPSREDELEAEEPSPATSRRSSAADVPSEDEMSWTADAYPPAVPGQGSFESTNSSMFATRGSTSNETAPIDADVGLEKDADTTMPDQASHDAVEDDDDIWAIEARRPTPVSAKAQKARDAVFKPKRRPLPKTWRRNDGSRSRNLGLPQVADMEEYSLLSLNNDENSRVSQKEQPAQQERPIKANLSAFFSSSPTGLGGGLFGRSVAGGASLFQTSRPASTAATSIEFDDNLPSVPERDLRPGSSRAVDLFSPAPPRQSSHDTQDDALMSQSSSPTTPEQPAFSHVPQKRNFTPSLGQNKTSLFNPGHISTANNLLSNPSHVLRHPSDEGSDEGSDESSDEDHDGSFVRPALKPLPSRHASPSKSCLRSPLKPKTPGRVVEFAPTAASPLEQAQARAAVRSATSSTRALFQPASSGGQKGVNPETEAGGHPNGPASLSILSTPRHGHLFQKQAGSPLSQTKWGRKHWVRLDQLLQQCRSAPLAFQLRHGGVTPRRRGSHALLGKQVTAQGETMRLEQWHLDIVDAFRREVSGWTESVLAKRLFALIIGEARRKAGLVPKRGRRAAFA